VRAAVALLVLLVLVLALVAGLVAVSSWLFPGTPSSSPQRCTTEVAGPDGQDLRAELAPDQTANAALIVGLANQRGLPARAATIGIATAIQESGLRNIDYGDRDSLGLFQQRPSQGWGSEAQVQDPLYATGEFYDALVVVDGYGALEITVAAQRVQRSGFPEAYADHEDEGRALASALYGLSPASLACDLDPLADDEPTERADPSTGFIPQSQALLDDLLAWGPGGWEQTDVADVAVEGAVDDADTDGRRPQVLTLDASAAAEPSRTAWALAHSAVAVAAARDVVRVEVDGQVWDRAKRAAGWVEAAAPGASPGEVLVTVG